MTELRPESGWSNSLWRSVRRKARKLLLRFAGTVFFLLGGGKSFFQADHVFSGPERVEGLGFFAQLFLGVVGGFDRQADATLELVHLNNARFDLLADFEHVFHFCDVVFAQFRDVDEPIDVVLQLNERAEASELGHFAFHQVADLVFLIDRLPRIFCELFDPEADPLVYLVDVDDHGFDFVAFLKDFARMIDLAGPAQIRHVDHSIDAFLQFHERAIGGHVANFAFHGAADGELLLDLIPRIGLELAKTERNFLLFFVYAKHNGFDFLANTKNVGRAHDPFSPRKFGDMDEAFHAFLDFNKCAVRNEIRDFAFDTLTSREAFLDLVPRIFLGLL